MANRDPAEGVSIDFGWLMLAVLLFSLSCVGMAGWGLWELVAYLRG